jgi:predicted lipoprotein
MKMESKVQRALLIGVSIFSLTACGGSSNSTPTDDKKDIEPVTGKKISELSENPSSICAGIKSAEFSCSNMLDSILTNAINPLVDELITELTALNIAVKDFGVVVGQEQEVVKLQEAQTQWRAAMSIWQQLEVMQFGTIAQQRNDFYSWPLNDECKVDVDVVLAQNSDYDISTRTAPRRGLDALEYLLFDSAGDNGKLHVRCQTVGAGKITDVPGLLEWDALTLNEQQLQRNKHSANITEFLISQANLLKKNLVAAPFDESITTFQAAADSISDAFFYVDKNTKDEKSNKALPASSSGSFNTEHLESQYAKVSLSNIHNNLIGANKIFTANEGIGFDDFLIASGQSVLGNRMLTNLNIAIDASLVSEDFDSMYSLLDAATLDQRDLCINAVAGGASSIEKICAIGSPIIKDFTDDLKNQFVLTLGFSIPQNAEGDND